MNRENTKFRKWYYDQNKKNLKKQNKSKTIRFLSNAHAIYESVKILPQISEYLLNVEDYKGLLGMLQNNFLFSSLIITALMWKSWFSPFMLKINQVQPLEVHYRSCRSLWRICCSKTCKQADRYCSL